MEEIFEELKKQQAQIENIQNELKVIKRIYFGFLVFKILIILLPIIGIILSIPKLVEFYSQITEVTGNIY